MNKFNENIIRVVIAIKLLVLLVFLISVIAVGVEQYNLSSSDFPENKKIEESKSGIAFYMILFLLPLLLSVIVDIKEQKHAVLKRQWYFLTLFLIACYTLINQLKEQHFIGLSIAAVMAVFLFLAIRKQNQSSAN